VERSPRRLFNALAKYCGFAARLPVCSTQRVILRLSAVSFAIVFGEADPPAHFPKFSFCLDRFAASTL
jgi:hypothetical protein